MDQALLKEQMLCSPPAQELHWHWTSLFLFPLPWTAQPTATEFDLGTLALHQLHPQDIWTGSLWWCLSFLGTVLSGNSTTTDLWDHRDTVSWGDLLMERCRELGRNLPSQRVPGILNSTQSSCEQNKCPKAKSNNNKIKKNKVKPVF